MGDPRENRVFDFEDFRLDAAHLLLYHHGKEVTLTPKAVVTLLALLESPGEVVSKKDLMEMIWADTVVEESNLAQYLHLLRKTLGKRRDGTQFIETLKRRGYRFSGEVTVSEGNSAASHQEGTKPNLPTEAHHLTEIHSRVERRGNVLALVDWQESRPEVVDDAKEVAESAVPLIEPPVSTFRPWWLAGAAGAVFLVIALSLVWLNSSPVDITRAFKGDLTFLNLTSGESLDSATISPNGNYFVYASHDDGKAHLWLQQTRQASRTEVIPPLEGSIYSMTFSPDSGFVYFVANEPPETTNVLYRVPALGGVQTKVASGIDSPVSVSPDGRSLVFTRWDYEASRSSLIIASSDGTPERVLLTRTGDDAISGGAWSPDGNLIAFGALSMLGGGGQCTILGIDPGSGEMRNLSPERWDTCFRMAWTADGKGLVFTGTKFREAYSTRRDQIFYLSIADGEARRLTTEGNRHQAVSLGVTDNDEILAVPFNRSAQIWSMDAGGDSRTAVQITTGQADGRSGMAALADGTISYLTRNGDGFSIWLTNADGTGRKQLTTDPPAIEELRAPPDGRFFVFAARLDQFSHLYRVDANGANLKQLTFGENQEIDSAVSPDGNWIVYASTVFKGTYGNPALWKVPSGGGEPVLLADTGCGAPNFSPDGKHLSCISDDWKKISVISAEDGSAVTSFNSGKNAILNVGARWAPDGKALAYISFFNNAGNIWLQPVNGESKYALTNFTSGDIFNFAFGVTDSRLYLARGNSIRNAILISNFK